MVTVSLIMIGVSLLDNDIGVGLFFLLPGLWLGLVLNYTQHIQEEQEARKSACVAACQAKGYAVKSCTKEDCFCDLATVLVEPTKP